VEAVLGKKIVEVVAGDAARNVGKALADEIAVSGGDLLECGGDLSGSVAAARYVRAAGQPGAAVPTWLD